MPLESPRLDDRSFDDLFREARQRIALYCPEWTDHNLSDPGITLMELFAWMTDILLYRLNRVPDKHYVKFMELIGMRLQEPAAARVPVTFWLTAPQPTEITIPAFTEVATTRTETSAAIVFSTDAAFTIRVPKLVSVMTSRGSERSGRAFTQQSLHQLRAGFNGFLAFTGGEGKGDKPQLDDAFYLGFDNDLSHHLLGVELDVSHAKGAGIDPTNPPYVWEAIGQEADRTWSEAKVDIDATNGLNETGLVRVHLPALRKDTRDGIEAYWVRCRLTQAPGVAGFNESPRIRKLGVASWGCTIPATNVATVEDELLGRSDGTPGQRFDLRHSPVVRRDKDQEYLVVRSKVGDVHHVQRWTEMGDFSTSGKDDPHYMIDGLTGEVRFGPALRQRDGQIKCYGLIPPKDAMITMTAYRYGGGQAGNVMPMTLNVNKSGLPYIQRVLNLEQATGGLDAESLDDIKLRVPGYLRSLQRAVTPGDFEYLAENEAAAEMVGRAHCFQSPKQPGLIRLLVIPKVYESNEQISPESLAVSDELRDRLIRFFDERRLLCTRLEVSAPEYQWVSVEVRLRPVRLSNKQEVHRAVSEKLYAFLNPLYGGPDGRGWPLGRDLSLSDVVGSLLPISGVDSIRSIKLVPVSFRDGRTVQGSSVEMLTLDDDQVIASFRHNVILE